MLFHGNRKGKCGAGHRWGVTPGVLAEVKAGPLWRQGAGGGGSQGGLGLSPSHNSHFGSRGSSGSSPGPCGKTDRMLRAPPGSHSAWVLPPPVPITSDSLWLSKLCLSLHNFSQQAVWEVAGPW